MQVLSAEFYRRDTKNVARELLGKRLVHVVDGVELSARITETEAYIGPEDKACHSYGWKRTGRTEVLYRPGGIAYIYLIYGMYHLLNAVTEPEGMPCAVLIRAAEPLEHCRDNIAMRRFGKEYSELNSAQRKNLLDGPGKLCRGLAIDMKINGSDLTSGSLHICDDTLPYHFRIEAGKRIGISYAEEAADWELRYIAVRE